MRFTSGDNQRLLFVWNEGASKKTVPLIYGTTEGATPYASKESVIRNIQGNGFVLRGSNLQKVSMHIPLIGENVADGSELYGYDHILRAFCRKITTKGNLRSYKFLHAIDDDSTMRPSLYYQIDLRKYYVFDNLVAQNWEFTWEAGRPQVFMKCDLLGVNDNTVTVMAPPADISEVSRRTERSTEPVKAMSVVIGSEELCGIHEMTITLNGEVKELYCQGAVYSPPLSSLECTFKVYTEQEPGNPYKGIEALRNLNDPFTVKVLFVHSNGTRFMFEMEKMMLKKDGLFTIGHNKEAREDILKFESLSGDELLKIAIVEPSEEDSRKETSLKEKDSRSEE